MSIKNDTRVPIRIQALAVGLAVLLSFGGGPLGAQQAQVAPGTLAGKATDEAKQPYSDWAVQLRDVASGVVASTKTLDDKGLFSFSGVALSQSYLVELVQIKNKKIVCTEGPYTLTPATPYKINVNINCGKVPAAIWLLAAGAGAATAIAVATRSTSR